MHYDFIAIPDGELPQAVEAAYQHVLATYAGETNKTVGVWPAIYGPSGDVKWDAADPTSGGRQAGPVNGHAGTDFVLPTMVES